MRIGGIIAGGVVSLIFAVIILPRSANVETCRCVQPLDGLRYQTRGAVVAGRRNQTSGQLKQ